MIKNQLDGLKEELRGEQIYSKNLIEKQNKEITDCTKVGKQIVTSQDIDEYKNTEKKLKSRIKELETEYAEAQKRIDGLSRTNNTFPGRKAGGYGSGSKNASPSWNRSPGAQAASGSANRRTNSNNSGGTPSYLRGTKASGAKMGIKSTPPKLGIYGSTRMPGYMKYKQNRDKPSPGPVNRGPSNTSRSPGVPRVYDSKSRSPAGYRFNANRNAPQQPQPPVKHAFMRAGQRSNNQSKSPAPQRSNSREGSLSVFERLYGLRKKADPKDEPNIRKINKPAAPIPKRNNFMNVTKLP